MKIYKDKLTKEFLLKEYIVNKKSSSEIGAKVKCSKVTVLNYLKKFNFPIRNNPEAQKINGLWKGKNNPQYKDGRCKKNHYCDDCGKEIDKQGRSKYCCSCKSNHYDNPMQGKHHIKQSRILIGDGSKAKWTPEFRRKLRKTCEERGLYIPFDKLDAYTIYYRECEWSDVLKVMHDFDNVRDHRYSRYSGFLNNVPSIIMRHPTNCQILSRSENISKRSNNSITLSQLINEIQNYDRCWFEQEECLEAIKAFPIEEVMVI